MHWQKQKDIRKTTNIFIKIERKAMLLSNKVRNKNLLIFFLSHFYIIFTDVNPKWKCFLLKFFIWIFVEFFNSKFKE